MGEGALVSERTRKRHQKKPADREEKVPGQYGSEENVSDCSSSKTPEQKTITDSAVSEDLDDMAVADFEDPEIYDCESVSSDKDSTQSDNTARIEENDLDSSDSDSSELADFG